MRVKGSDELAGLHLQALYVFDAKGRIVRVNAAKNAKPRLHLFRTPTRNHWAVAATCPDALRARLEAQLAAEPRVASCEEMEQRPPALAPLHALLGDNAETASDYRGPAYVFPDLIPPQEHAGTVAVAAPGQAVEAPGFLAWIRDTSDAERPLVIARDAGGVVVAVCHSARSTARAAEAGVETAATSRRAGYGSAVVAAWALAVRAGGRVPLYSTSWENKASQALARRLRLICYGEDLHID